MPLVSTLCSSVEYLAHARAVGRRPATIESYEYALRQLKEWRQTDDDLATVTRIEARAFVRYLTERYAASGVESRLKRYRAFYRWCVAEDICEANPFEGLSVRVPDEPKLTATDEQVASMLERAKRSRRPRRDVALLTVLADTGCRKGELAALGVEHVDLNSGTITFPTSKSRPRTVPLSDRAVRALGRYLRQRGTRSGPLWCVEDQYSLVKCVVKRHSRGELTPHALRRRFAVTWLLQGGSETSLMRIAGWSSRDMIALYSKASADVIAAEEFRRLMA